jgi:hypothetical protein
MKAFVKFVLVFAILGGLVYELGSPVWSRTAADTAAQEAAGTAAQTYFGGGTLTAARADAVVAATERGATLTDLQLLPDGDIQVTVTRPAKSYVLHDISGLKGWYNVKASASAGPNDPLTS